MNKNLVNVVTTLVVVVILLAVIPTHGQENNESSDITNFGEILINSSKSAGSAKFVTDTSSIGGGHSPQVCPVI